MSAATTERKSITPGTTRSERDNGRAHDRRATPPASASPVPLAAAGNQTVAALYSEGIVRAHLQVGAPDDPVEAEADRMAAAALRGEPCTCAAGAPPCPRCQAAARAMIRRKPRAAGRAPAAADNLSLGAGRGLGQPERRFFEARYQTDLSNVRIHDDAQAAANAAQLDARAFSVGERIAFGPGEYRPQSQEGRALLAHELAHVVQGHSGIRRQGQSTEPNMTPADANASFEPPPGPNQSSILDPAHTEHDDAFDPCALDVAGLTNYRLLAEYSHAMSFVNRGRGAPHYFDYRNLQRRLIAERDRRVDMGHTWLATMPSTIPNPLYRIVDSGAGTFHVLSVSGGTVAGAPENTRDSPLMTREQFDRNLALFNVERVDADTYRMRVFGTDPTGPASLGGPDAGLFPAAGGPPNTPLVFLPSVWRPPMLPASAAPVAPFTGGPPLPEIFGQPDWFTRQPEYMRIDQLLNPPALDPQRAAALRAALRLYRSQPGVPRRIDPLGALGEAAGPVQGGTAAVAQTDIPTLDTLHFPGASAEALPPAFRGQVTGGSEFVAANPTAVNHAEHVALENLRAAIDGALQRGELTRASLRGRTVFLMVEQEPCSSCASGAAEGRAGVLQQFAERYPELTVEVRNMRTTRAYIYRNGQLLNPPSGEIPVEALPIAPAEPGGTPAPVEPVGFFRTGTGASALGAGMGAGFAVLANGVIIAFDSRTHPEWSRELAISGGLGAVGGGTSTITERVLQTTLERSMMADITATGSSRMTASMATGMGRFGGGAVGAMFVEGISMGLLEEREHSGAEVATRLTRSAALGGSSVWAGAAIGTAVGGPVGFIVGLVAGGIIYYVGDKIVPGGREDWDALEAGCQPAPAPSSSSVTRGFSSPMFACFEGDTPVMLADGATRRIGDLAVGDLVLSYHERERRLESRRVTAVHEAPPDRMLALQLTDGTVLHVTEAHKLSGPEGWRAAAELRAGDTLWSIDRDPASAVVRLAGSTVASVRVSAPRGPVYDLSVEETHTYFAASVLAHNKLP